MKKHPILYAATEQSFQTNGIGVLSDAVQCDVTEEINGIFELFMAYPSNGRLLHELKNNRIIYADASRDLGMQPFRIFSINKLMNGFVNVYARHISYDLGGIQLTPMEAYGIQDALNKIKTYSTTDNPFVLSTSIIDDAAADPIALKNNIPKSARAFLMGNKESVLTAYGGEFVFDKYNVYHVLKRGSDKGFRVRYGVNLIDLNQEESIENTYTGIFPYYKSQYIYKDLTETFDLMYPIEPNPEKIAGKIRYSGGNFEHQKIASVDLSPFFETEPLYDEEFTYAVDLYMHENKIGVPTVSLDLRYVELQRIPEYSNIPTPDDVSLGDTIHVEYVKLGVSAAARINSIIYDSLAHKNKRVSIGDVKNNVTDSIVKSINTQKTSQPISGDKINLTGYVTFSSLGANGTTSIDGSRIKTGQISSENYQNDIIIIDPEVDEAIPAGSYWFSLLYESGDKFLLFSKQVPKGGKIYYFQSQSTVSTYDGNGGLIETVSVSSELDRYAQKLNVKIEAYFSEAGTMIDLESGDIVSERFSILNGYPFFGGVIKSDDAQLGPLSFAKDMVLFGGFGKTFELANGIEGGVFSALSKQYFTYLLQDLTNGTTVGIDIGEMLPHEYTELKAKLTGKWLATPYTSPGSNNESEIITKQDLINLGLLTE